MEKKIKLLTLILIIFLPFILNANSKFSPNINKQIEIINKINDLNITQEQIIEVLDEQELFYKNIIEDIFLNKQKYLDRSVSHNAEIYSLEKIINVNKRRSNVYAVIRDEVLIKSYKVIDYQALMVKEILQILDEHEYEEFQSKISDIFIKNQIKIDELNNVDYNYILEIKDDSNVVNEAQKNIKDFNAILEINIDVLKYLSIFDKKIYTLNKYSKFNLVKPIVIINKLPFVNEINSFISYYGFSVVKLIVIIFLILFVYLLRTVFYNILEKYIIGIESLKLYSKEILQSIRKLIEVLIIFINIELVLYVYNDFRTIPDIDKSFNIIYALILTSLVYRIINTIAKIIVEDIQKEDGKSVKFEILNVGIKIINVTIWIIGLLIVLFLAGVNLTAVLSGLGIGGFAVALAAKDSLANFFGTLNILFSDTFSQGDWIKVDGVEGTVIEIGLRVTTLRTFDNAMISIPNATVANKDIRNWNRRSLGRRIKMSLGVKYDSKPQDIKNAVAEIYNMLDKHPGIATKNTDFQYSVKKRKLKIVHSKDDSEGVKKTLLVYLDEFGSSSINILIYCFSKTVKWAEWLEVKQDVMYKMMEILEKNNLEFAFPSMSLYHENNLELSEQKET